MSKEKSRNIKSSFRIVTIVPALVLLTMLSIFALFIALYMSTNNMVFLFVLIGLLVFLGSGYIALCFFAVRFYYRVFYYGLYEVTEKNLKALVKGNANLESYPAVDIVEVKELNEQTEHVKTVLENAYLVTHSPDFSKLDLEYIAIIPKGNINDYIKQLDQYELSKLLSNVKSPSTATDITMTIPKYSYDFTFDKIKLILYEKGITKAFEEGANFKLISKDAKLILSDIIQKTYIDFGEEGTYSAPVYFEKTTAKKKTTKKKTTDTKAAAQPTNETVTQKEQVNIDFNQPFIYLVKERNGTNIWLFGVVYEPTLWEDYAKLVENAKKEYERSLRGY